MLTERTKNAIGLLCEAGGMGKPSCIQPVIQLEYQERELLKEALISYGLIDGKGQLCRPLNEISLYEVLIATGEGIELHAYYQEENHYPFYPGRHKLNMCREVFRQLLGKVKIPEL